MPQCSREKRKPISWLINYISLIFKWVKVVLELYIGNWLQVKSPSFTLKNVPTVYIYIDIIRHIT